MALLNDISSIVMGQSPKSSTYNEDEKGLPFYQGKAEFGEYYPTPVKWCSKPGKIAEKGDVLISVRAPVGPTNICQERSCIGRGLAAIRPLDGIPTQYIQYWLITKQRELEAKSTGTTFKAISGDTLRNLEINLHPLSEQKRIVAKIESLFSRLDSAKDSLERVRQEIRRYRQAVLKSVFEGDLTEGINFKLKKLFEVGEVVTGNTPSKSRKDYYGGEINFFKPTDLNAGISMYKSRDKLTKSGLEKGRFAKVGSVLVTCIGATIGKTAFMNEDGAFNQQINAVIPNNGISGKYLYYFFISKGFQDDLIGGASSTTMPIINKTRFENLKVPLCDSKQQIEIVGAIELSFERAKTLEDTIEQGLDRIDQLKQSILKQAFEGKLVESDPNDEPVEILLERIKKEKQSLIVVKKNNLNKETRNAKRN